MLRRASRLTTTASLAWMSVDAAADASRSPDVAQVLAALQALYHDPDARAKQHANQALLAFQKTPQAWSTANTLLMAQDLPLESRLFSAQTFRSKATYDLDQLAGTSQEQLRDTLLHALDMYAAGPRVIQTQLCLALAVLALQMPEERWGNVVPSMITRFGGAPSTVGVLLEFLTVLPEEASVNHRIPLDNRTYYERVPQLLTQHAGAVLEVLTMYIHAQGVTSAIQASVFACLRSWLKAGEVTAQQLAHTPLLECAFDALRDEALFDTAVDVICDLINETQELEENRNVIEQLLPRIDGLRPALTAAGEDEDQVRGLCRIFVQAGETYHALALHHVEALVPIAQAALECASYHDLDIVQITFRFWYLLAMDVRRGIDHGGDTAAAAAPYRSVYEQLFAIILRHLRFPDDDAELHGQERDDFRSFRHYMGDTLKDCCYVLGAEACIVRSLELIDAALAQGSPELRWQDIEAPLFSIRSMGAEVNVQTSEVVPRIFAIVPRLPPHPRLRYAGLLVVSRYTEWVAEHAEHLGEVLTFITNGFDAADRDIAAAAAQAMDYLCQDCRKNLVPLFPELLTFFRSVHTSLGVDDLLAVSGALAHVIKAMPPHAATDALFQLAHPLLESVHAVSEMPSASKPDLMRAADRLEQLARILQVIGVSLVDALPASCASTCSEAYAIIDRLLARYGDVYFLSERTSALVRRALIFFDKLAAMALPALLERFGACFESTGFSGYVWIIGKSIEQFGPHSPDVLMARLAHAFERITHKTAAMLSTAAAPDAMSDVLDDYLHTCVVTTQAAPAFLLGSAPLLAQAYAMALKSLGALSPSLVGIATDFVQLLAEYTHESPTPEREFADTIHMVLGDRGPETCQALLSGLVTHFPPENMPAVVAAMRALAVDFPGQVPTWASAAVQALPSEAISDSDKAHFIEHVHAPSVAERIQPTLVMLYGASRKSRERAQLE